MSNNLILQDEEIEVLQSIYPDSLVLVDDRTLIFEFKKSDLMIRFQVTMSPGYPTNCLPNYTISAPFLRGSKKEALDKKLKNTEQQIMDGDPIIHLWIDCILEFLEIEAENQLENLNDSNESNSSSNKDLEKDFQTLVKCPDIFTGSCIEDRKSVFQGHYAVVKSIEEVNAVLSTLKSNKKIGNATHNMFAYRIMLKGSLLSDCDDDGESKAGGRILELLDVLNLNNVIVVVSRWYGGIKLGPDRFRHIKNAARLVLEEANVVSKGKNSK